MLSFLLYLITKHILARKFGGNKEMEEIVKSFIGKDVEIHMIEEEVIVGTILSYNDGWIMYRNTKDAEIALNCFYITQIKPTDYLEKLRAKKAKKEAKKD